MHLTERQNSTDICVLGGGIVGLAIAIGLLRNGHQVVILDEGDIALRASRGNFGLVWVQGKGDTLPKYASISRMSAKLWKPLADRLFESTGMDIQLQQCGGLYICLSEKELQARHQMLLQLQRDAMGDYPFKVLNLTEAREFIPALGPEVAGATWCPEDGHLNPLLMMRAMTETFTNAGGKIRHSGKAQKITPLTQGFNVSTETESWFCNKVVLSAGLGNKELAPMVGLYAPLTPNRGQVLISERMTPFLNYPTGHVRQTGEGTIQLGDSKEDVGFDTGTSIDVMAQIAARARKMFPLLNNVRLVRAWGALRVMTPDGYPIYEQSSQHPGAYLVTCHSGVTLGAFHEGPIANWISQNNSNVSLEEFHAKRFRL